MNQVSKFITSTCLILLVGLSFGCAHESNGSSQTSLAATRTTPPSIPQPPLAPTPAKNPEDQMPRVRADDAIKLAQSGQALIIDVRGSETYKSQHAVGAIDFPLERLEKGDFKGLPRDKQIIAYCT